jgi:hypothetical protein
MHWENILSRTTKQPVKLQSQQIFIQIASEKFPPKQYEDTIIWMVQSNIIKVDLQNLMKEINLYKEALFKKANMMQMHALQMQKSHRPSLFKIAQESRKGHISSLSSSSYEEYYTYQGFTYKMRFPNSLSTHVKQRAYWLASQPEHLRWR